ncbi:MAG: hypothetical protein IJF58_04685 [Clostridia bacterium]|nr:hypothetical protein [Clostridia bacterium]
MENKNKLKAALPVILFALLCAIVLGLIAILPYDRPATSPNNSFMNLYNGGFVAQDGSLTYYIDSEGSLYCAGDNSKYYIDKASDSLCPYNVGIVYRTENDEVKYSDFDGGSVKTLIKGAKQMSVSGNWVFYTDEKDDLYKYFLQTGETKKVGLNVDQFMISSTAVVYLKEGKLYTARTDGTQIKPFLADKADGFVRYESYMFYKADGMLYSVASGNTANKQTYFEVDEFNINDKGIMFYTLDGKLYSKDITDEKAKAKELKVGTVKGGLCTNGDRVCFYDEKGNLVSCLADGSEVKELAKINDKEQK